MQSAAVLPSVVSHRQDVQELLDQVRTGAVSPSSVSDHVSPQFQASPYLQLASDALQSMCLVSPKWQIELHCCCGCGSM